MADTNRKTGPVSVSIIIPCFNGSRYIPRLVSSLRPALDSATEVIFVDDGSTDDSFEQFQRHMPEAVLIKQRNAGLGATRNRAAAIARGEFLQLLDVDDTIESGKLASQLRFARKRSLDVIYSDWRMVIVDGESEQPEGWVHAKTEVEIVEALLGGWWFPPNAALVRREAFLSVGGCDSSLGNTVEDFDLWVRLGIAGCRFGYMPGRFANYFRHMRVRSMTRKDPRELFEGEARIILNAVQLLTERTAITSARRRAAARRLHAAARNVYALDRQWYRRMIKDLFQLDPDFHPGGTLTYRVIARLLGLETAERLATLKRKAIKRSE